MWRASGVLLLIVCGCSPGPSLAPVSGRVLVEGKPVRGLRVIFSPVGSATNQFPGPASVGYTDQDGRYTLSSVKSKRGGAVVGPCEVRVEWTTVGTDPHDKVEKDLLEARRRLPARYNDATELKFDVPASGTTEANFELQWK